jgi:phospholipid/cholesterol/gamma-HCH transport system ATP-binding protein
VANPNGKKVVISVRDLVQEFDGRRVLDGVNLDVYEGETLVIMGGSGCGKSTFLRALVGLYRPTSGSICYEGKNILELSEAEMNEIKKKFGILFQGAALFNSMTIGENIALPLREHAKLARKIIDIIVKVKLELVGLTGFEHLLPSQISGGMKKRVGLARAIALDPRIVFYDEPGAGLDPITASVIDKLIMDLTKKLGITSVVVTHEMTSAFRIADRMIMFHKGQIIEEGTANEIRHSKNPYVQQFITGSFDGPIPLRRSSEEYQKSLLG